MRFWKSRALAYPLACVSASTPASECETSSGWLSRQVGEMNRRRNYRRHAAVKFFPCCLLNDRSWDSAAERAWREALRFTTASADREFLRRHLAVCRPEGGEPGRHNAG